MVNRLMTYSNPPHIYGNHISKNTKYKWYMKICYNKKELNSLIEETNNGKDLFG